MSFIVLAFAFLRDGNTIIAMYFLNQQVQIKLLSSSSVLKTENLRTQTFLSVQTSILLKAWTKNQLQTLTYESKNIPGIVSQRSLLLTSQPTSVNVIKILNYFNQVIQTIETSKQVAKTTALNSTTASTSKTPKNLPLNLSQNNMKAISIFTSQPYVPS